MLDHARAILAAQPFSTLLGTELTRYEVGITEMQLDLSDKIKQQLGFAHGGVLAYLADISMTFAGGSVLQNVLTSEIKINYLRPARVQNIDLFEFSLTAVMNVGGQG